MRSTIPFLCSVNADDPHTHGTPTTYLPITFGAYHPPTHQASTQIVPVAQHLPTEKTTPTAGPQATHTSAASTARPPVANRLLESPRHTPQPVQLSRAVRERMDLALQHCLSDATLKSYGYSINKFEAFCTDEEIPDNMRWPADEFVLCAFAASNATVLAGTTIKNHLAALKAWHGAHNIPWQGGPRLSYVLSGVANLSPVSSKRAPRPPITRPMIHALHEGLDLTNPFDAAVLATACAAFWGQCRLGELLCTSSTTFSSTKFPTAASVTFTADAAVLALPWTKTKKAHGDSVALTKQLPPVDPVAAMRAHLALSDPPRAGHLFAYEHSGTHRPLTRAAFLRRCNEVWNACGYPRATGHGFRIGGTTELLLAGVHPDVVKALGRWSSDAFLVYWRSLGELAPLHTSLLPIRRH